MYVPSGLKTVDGKDIMCYTGAFYLKNKEKIDKMLKKCEEILREEDKKSKKFQKKSTKQFKGKIIIREDEEKYDINQKHDKMFKEMLSDKKSTVDFINSFLHLNLVEDDIEEKVEGYAENWLGYTLIDVNEFSKEELLADNLIITKAMLIEKSKNKEELYKNIEEVINIQKEKKAFDNLQLEKLITYELSETEDKNIMHEFIEKIRNIEGSEEIMTNASRIINREIRKQRNEGREEGKILGIAEGIALIAKRLKEEMNIKDISRITGLSESDIENL